MARKRPGVPEATEQSFVQRLAQALIDSNPHIDAKVRQRVAVLRKSFREVLENQLGVRRETIARKLVEIIETPVEEVANSSNSPLAQKIKRKRLFVGRGDDKEEWETEEIETSSRMDAIKELNKMAGWHEAEKVEVSGDDTLKAALQLLTHGKPKS